MTIRDRPFDSHPQRAESPPAAGMKPVELSISQVALVRINPAQPNPVGTLALTKKISGRSAAIAAAVFLSILSHKTSETALVTS
jgi:hypothetical protein